MTGWQMTSRWIIFHCYIQNTSDEIINYFEVSADSIDSVLDIFVRVNSGGTVLSKSDLCFQLLFLTGIRQETKSINC